MAKGSIRKRGNKYQITVDVGVDPTTGERKRHYETLPTHADAERKLAEIIRQVEAGTYIKETDKTVHEFLTEWLDLTRRQLRPTTEYVYRSYIKLLEPFLPKIKAKDLNKRQAESIISSLADRYKPSTVTVCRRLLSTAFNRGIEWEIIVKNPFKGIRIKQERKEYVVWTPEQVATFLDAVRYSCEHNNGNWSYYVAFCIAIHAGMRKSEILGLRWSNVDLANKQIYVKESIHELYGKGAKHVDDPKSKAGRRTIIIDDTLATELERHKSRQQKEEVATPLPPNDYIITTSQLKPIHPRNLTAVMYRIITAENLPRLRFHDLRHTHASLLLSAGVSPKVIQERLGHSNIQTTMNIYSHVLPSLQQEAADKIGEMLSLADR